MDTGELQKAVDNWFKEIGAEYYSPSGIMLQMIEEVGELAREVNNKYGERFKKKGEEEDNTKKEIGGVLLALISLCNVLDIDMGETLKTTLEQNKIRDKDRFKN